jgi:repressor LexA
MESARQREIYEFVVAYARDHGYPPTVREIGAEVGLASPSTVHAHLAKLEQNGYLRRDPTKPRALELVRRDVTAGAGRPDDVVRLPLVGRIAAGGPLLAEENVEDHLAVPEPLARGDGEEFLLRVKGDSMRDAGILEDDYLVVRRQPTARDGEIVAALVGDDEGASEATVKRFYAEQGRVRLQPENPDYVPLYPAHVQILGKVIGVFRRL